MNENIIFDKEKFKEVLHYLISRCGYRNNVGKTVIFKLLYFTDFDFYELYETSLTGEKYIRKPQGPVPTHFDEAKDELVKEGKIHEESEKVIDYKKYKYSSLKPSNPTLLNKNELTIINDVLNKISQMRSKQVSDYSHGDMPWKVAEDNGELDYEFVFYRSPEYSVRDYDD